MTTKELIDALQQMPQDATVDFVYETIPNWRGERTDTKTVSEVAKRTCGIVLSGE